MQQIMAIAKVPEITFIKICILVKNRFHLLKSSVSSKNTNLELGIISRKQPE